MNFKAYDFEFKFSKNTKKLVKIIFKNSKKKRKKKIFFEKLGLETKDYCSAYSLSDYHYHFLSLISKKTSRKLFKNQEKVCLVGVTQRFVCLSDALFTVHFLSFFSISYFYFVDFIEKLKSKWYRNLKIFEKKNSKKKFLIKFCNFRFETQNLI